MNKRRKVLIIKSGYSETFVPRTRTVCSLGDVLRTTPVLHLFKNDHLTWLTDEAALPLLEGIPLINRVITFGAPETTELENEVFDNVINLEKVPGICALADKIRTDERYGFSLDTETAKAKSCDPVCESLVVRTHEDALRLDRPWIELVYEMLGAKWQGEGYLVGHKPGTEAKFDIGFNIHVGTLCPLKAWPAEYWEDLDARVSNKYQTSYQQCLKDLRGYIDWVNSCRLLVTNDSLGLHLGLALGKQVLSLFGPTSASDIGPWWGLHIISSPTPCEYRPCYAENCILGETCMRGISPDMVSEQIERILA